MFDLTWRQNVGEVMRLRVMEDIPDVTSTNCGDIWEAAVLMIPRLVSRQSKYIKDRKTRPLRLEVDQKFRA